MNQKEVTSGLSNLKNNVDKLDVDKLVPVPTDLNKLNDVVKNKIVKKDVLELVKKQIMMLRSMRLKMKYLVLLAQLLLLLYHQ